MTTTTKILNVDININIEDATNDINKLSRQISSIEIPPVQIEFDWSKLYSDLDRIESRIRSSLESVSIRTERPRYSEPSVFDEPSTFDRPSFSDYYPDLDETQNQVKHTVKELEKLADTIRALSEAHYGEEDLNRLRKTVTGITQKSWEEIEQALRGFSEEWATIWDQIRSGTIRTTKDLHDKLIGHSIIPDMGDAIIAYLRKLRNTLSNLNIFKGVERSIHSDIGDISDNIKQIEPIINATMSEIRNIVSSGEKGIDLLANDIEKASSKIKTEFKDISNAAKVGLDELVLNIKNAANNIAQPFKDIGNAAKRGIAELSKDLSNIKGTISRNLDFIKNEFNTADVFGSSLNIGEHITGSISDAFIEDPIERKVAAYLNRMSLAVRKHAREMSLGLKSNKSQSIIGMFTDDVEGVTNEIQLLIKEISRNTSNLLTSPSFKKDVTTYVKLFLQTYDEIVSYTKSFKQAIIQSTSSLFNGIYNSAKALYNRLIGHSLIPDMGDAIIAFLRKLRNVLSNIKIFQGVEESIHSNIGNISDNIGQIEPVINTTISEIKKVFTSGRNGVDLLANDIKKASEGIKEEFKDVSNAAKTGFKELLLELNTISNKVTQPFRDIRDAAKRGVSELSADLSNIKGIISKNLRFIGDKFDSADVFGSALNIGEYITSSISDAFIEDPIEKKVAAYLNRISAAVRKNSRVLSQGLESTRGRAFISLFTDDIDGVTNELQQLIQEVSRNTSNLLASPAFKKNITEYIKLFLLTYSEIVSYTKGFKEKIIKSVFSIYGNLFNGAKALYNKLIGHSLIPEMGNEIVSYLTSLRGSIGKTDIFNPLITSASNLVNGISTAFIEDPIEKKVNRYINRITTAFSSLSVNIQKALDTPSMQKKLSMFTTDVPGTTDLLKNTIKQQVAAISDALNSKEFRQNATLIIKITIALIDEIKEYIQNGVNNIRKLINFICSDIYNRIKKLYDRLIGHSLIPEMGTKILKYVSHLKDNILKKVKAITQDISSAFSSLKEKLPDPFSKLRENKLRDIKGDFQEIVRFLHKQGDIEQLSKILQLEPGEKMKLKGDIDEVTSYIENKISELRKRGQILRTFGLSGSSYKVGDLSDIRVPSLHFTKDIKGKFSEVHADLVYTINLSSTLTHIMAETLPQAVDTVTQKFSRMAGIISGKVADGIERIRDRIPALTGVSIPGADPSKIYEKVSNTAEEFRNEIDKTSGAIRENVEEMQRTIKGSETYERVSNTAEELRNEIDKTSATIRENAEEMQRTVKGSETYERVSSATGKLRDEINRTSETIRENAEEMQRAVKGSEAYKTGMRDIKAIFGDTESQIQQFSDSLDPVMRKMREKVTRIYSEGTLAGVSPGFGMRADEGALEGLNRLMDNYGGIVTSVEQVLSGPLSNRLTALRRLFFGVSESSNVFAGALDSISNYLFRASKSVDDYTSSAEQMALGMQEAGVYINASMVMMAEQSDLPAKAFRGITDNANLLRREWENLVGALRRNSDIRKVESQLQSTGNKLATLGYEIDALKEKEILDPEELQKLEELELYLRENERAFKQLINMKRAAEKTSVEYAHSIFSVLGILERLKKNITSLMASIIGGALFVFKGGWRSILSSVGTFVNKTIGYFRYLHEELVGHSIIPDMIMLISKWMWRLPAMAAGVGRRFVSVLLSPLRFLHRQIKGVFDRIFFTISLDNLFDEAIIQLRKFANEFARVANLFEGTTITVQNMLRGTDFEKDLDRQKAAVKGFFDFVISVGQLSTYTVDEVLKATTQLTIFGFDPQEWLKPAIDAVTAMDKPIEQFVRALQKLSSGAAGDAVLQMQDLGINVYEVGAWFDEATGEALTFEEAAQAAAGNVKDSWVKMRWDISAGNYKWLRENKELAKEIFKAYLSQDAKFAGAAESRANTVEGMLSNLEDSTMRMIGAFSGPLWEQAGVIIGDILADTMAVQEETEAWLELIGTDLARIIDNVYQEIKSLLMTGGELPDFMYEIAYLLNSIAEGDWDAAWELVKLKALEALKFVMDNMGEFLVKAADWAASFITEIADGLIQAASTILVSAVETIAEIIASFFEPGSPPKEGPLSTIDQWGKGLVDTLFESFTEYDTDLLISVANSIKDVFTSPAGELDIGLLESFHNQFGSILDTINKTGQYTEGAFQSVIQQLGIANTGMEEFLRSQLDLKVIQEEYNKAAEAGFVPEELEEELEHAKAMVKLREYYANQQQTSSGSGTSSESTTDYKKTYEEELKLLEDKRNIGLVTEEEYLSSRVSLEKKYAEEALKAGDMATAKQKVQLIESLENQLSKIREESKEKEIASYKEQYEKELELLEWKYKNGLISHDEYIKGLLSAEKKYVEAAYEAGDTSGLESHINKIKQLESQLNKDVTQTTKDRYEEEKALLKKKYELGLISHDEYIKGLISIEERFVESSLESGVVHGLDEHINRINELKKQVGKLSIGDQLTQDLDTLRKKLELGVIDQKEYFEEEIRLREKYVDKLFDNGEATESNVAKQLDLITSLKLQLQELNREAGAMEPLTTEEVFAGFEERGKEAIKNIDAIKEEITGKFEEIPETLKTKLKEGITESFANIKDDIKDGIADAIKDSFPGLAKILEPLTGMANWIMETVAPRIEAAFGEVNDGIRSTENTANNAMSDIQDPLDKQIESFKEYWDTPNEKGLKGWERLKKQITDTGKVLATSGIMGFLIGYFAIEKPKYLMGIITGISGVIKDMASRIAKTKLWQTIVAIYNLLVNKLFPLIKKEAKKVLALLLNPKELIGKIMGFLKNPKFWGLTASILFWAAFAYGVKTNTEKLIAIFDDFVGRLRKSINLLIESVQRLWGIIKTKFNDIKEWFMSLEFSPSLIKLKDTLLDTVTDIFGGLFDAIGGILKAVFLFPIQLAMSLISLVLLDPENAKKQFGYALDTLKTALVDDFFGGMFDMDLAILEGLTTLPINFVAMIAEWLGFDGIATYLNETFAEKVKEFVVGIPETIHNMLTGETGVGEGLSDILGTFGLDVPAEDIISIFDSIKDLITDSIGIDSFLESLQDLTTSIKELWGAIKELWRVMVLIYMGVGKAFLEVFKEIWEVIKPFFDELWKILKELPWEYIIESVLKPLAYLIGGILLVGLGLLIVSLGILTAVLSGIVKVMKFTVEMVKRIIDGFKLFVQGVRETIEGFVTIIAGIFTGNWDMILEGLKKFGLGIWRVVKGIFLTVINIIGLSVGMIFALIWGLVEGVIKFFKNLYNELVGNSIVPDLMDEILLQFTRLPEEVLTVIRNFINEALDIIGDIYDGIVELDMFEAGKDMIQRLMDGIKSLLPDLQNIQLFGEGGTLSETWGDIRDKIPGFASGAWNIPSDTLAMVHKGEMIIPSRVADNIRSNNNNTSMNVNITLPNVTDGRSAQGIMDVLNNRAKLAKLSGSV